jgi:8-oxo-dGTP diphosphatase
VHRPRQKDWSFPKGKLLPGEHVLAAAAREVREETGTRPVLGRPLAAIQYAVAGGLKRVDFWVAEPDGLPGGFTPNSEIDAVTWADAAQARTLLSNGQHLELLEKFIAGPVRTAPYVLLRHTSAGDKNRWRGEDALRHLDSRGRDDAFRLTLMESYGALRVLSSPTARCVETVLPLATRMGVAVTTADEFGIDGLGPGPGRFTALLREEVPTLVCTHGELIPALLGHALDSLGARERPHDLTLRKGHFWVLHVAGGALAGLERHTPIGV